MDVIQNIIHYERAIIETRSGSTNVKRRQIQYYFLIIFKEVTGVYMFLAVNFKALSSYPVMFESSKKIF